MGLGESKDQELYIQALKAKLKIRGSRVRSLQLMQLLDFVTMHLGFPPQA
jgi:hypothetical protein